MLSSKEFLDAFFEKVIPGNVFYLWTMPGKKTTCFTDTDKAAEFAVKNKDKEVYFGLNPVSENIKANSRAYNDTVSAVTCFWIDVDIKHETHKKKNLPENLDEALSIIENVFPYMPSIIVNSGGGAHIYWILKEPVILTKDEAGDKRREEVGTLINILQTKIKNEFERHGYTCDKTHDLARVLRVAGTVNNKIKENPRPVEVIKSTSARYTIEQIKSMLAMNLQQEDIPVKPKEKLKEEKRVEKETKVQEKKEINPADNIHVEEKDNPLKLVFNPNAEPPQMKLMAMLEMEPKFRAAYHMEEMKGKKKWSFSEYDMCLANYAANNGWENQEICNLLIAFRRLRGKTEEDRKKGLRVNYITNTILKSRQHRDLTQSTERLEQYNLEAKETGKVPEDKSGIINSLSKVMGIKVIAVRKYLTGIDPTFEIETERGNVFVKDANTLINERLLRAAFAAKTNHYLPGFGKGKWEPVAQNLLFVCEDVEVGAEATEHEALRELVEVYISKSQTTKDYNEAHINEMPYWKNGKLHIFSHAFQFWLKTQGENYPKKELARLMRVLGYEHKKDNFYPIDAPATSRNVYIVKSEKEETRSAGQHIQ